MTEFVAQVQMIEQNFILFAKLEQKLSCNDITLLGNYFRVNDVRFKFKYSFIFMLF